MQHVLASMQWKNPISSSEETFSGHRDPRDGELLDNFRFDMLCLNDHFLLLFVGFLSSDLGLGQVYDVLLVGQPIGDIKIVQPGLRLRHVGLGWHQVVVSEIICITSSSMEDSHTSISLLRRFSMTCTAGFLCLAIVTCGAGAAKLNCEWS